MKSSGWSSRGTWACSGAAALALALAPAAAAHVGISPTRVEPGADAEVVFTVPDEGGWAITRITVAMPPDIRLGQARREPGWTLHSDARTVVWQGGRIRPGELVDFAITVTAPATTERALFTVLASMRNGRTDTYHPALEIAPAPSTRDAGARTLATAALIVAAAAALVGLAAGFLALWLWLRPRPPDRFEV